MIKRLTKKILYPIVKSKPDFLIVGAQKAGTTSLYNYLIQHPKIIKNKSWKEVHYFDQLENYQQGMSWYLGHFPNKFYKGNKLLVEATPEYLYYKHVPQLIKQDLGNIKIIIILRNPIDRAYSAWQMYHSFSDNPNEHLRVKYDHRSFSEAIQQEINSQSESDNEPYHYLERGKYVYQLENYFNYFNKSNILILNFNELKQIGHLLNEVCKFLNIEPFKKEDIDKFSKSKYNVGSYQKTVSDQATFEFLTDYYQPYNQQLEKLLNRTFDWF